MQVQGTAQFTCIVQVDGELTIKGKKSAAVAFPDGTHRRMYCMESPESWFEDFGFGRFTNGQAHVDLDPGFSEDELLVRRTARDRPPASRYDPAPGQPTGVSAIAL